jgi:Protein of unknown function (DUF1185).
MKAEIRKIVVTVEETRHEMGKEIDPPTRKAVAAAVIKNPFAGLYVEDLEQLMAIGEELGGCWARRPWRRSASRQADRELWQGRHRRREGRMGACRRHPASAPRQAAARRGGEGAALVPSAKKLGGLGTAIDVPLGP